MDNSSSRKSGWTLTLGILLMLLGIVTLSAQVFTTFFSVLFLGWMLIIGGVAEFFYGFFSGSMGRAFVFFLGGIMSFVIGGVIAANPVISAGTFTILIGVFMVVVGVYKTLASIINRFPNWGWSFIGGIATILLGVLIFSHWPSSGLWIIGLFIGVELFISGFVLMGNAFRPAEYDEPSYGSSAYVSGAKGGSAEKNIKGESNDNE
jgi:uncharacterized membrane protein HdeD (DUF308 family)